MDITFDQLESARPDEVLTGIALDTPVEGLIADRMFPDSDPGPSTIEIPDWGAQGNQTLVGTVRSARSNKPPTFTLDIASIGTHKLDIHWFQIQINGLLEKMANERVMFRRMSLEARKQRTVNGQWKMTKEQFAANVMASGAVFDGTNSSTLSGTARWSDDASDPIKEVLAKKLAVAILTGFMPNKMQMPIQVLHRLRQHPNIKTRLPANHEGDATLPQLADFFELDEIIVSHSLVNSAAPKKAKALSWLWPTDEVILFYQAPVLNEETRSFTVNFKWDAVPELIAYRVQNDPDFYYIRNTEVLKYAVLDRLCAYKWKGVLA